MSFWTDSGDHNFFKKNPSWQVVFLASLSFYTHTGIQTCWLNPCKFKPFNLLRQVTLKDCLVLLDSYDGCVDLCCQRQKKHSVVRFFSNKFFFITTFHGFPFLVMVLWQINMTAGTPKNFDLPLKANTLDQLLVCFVGFLFLIWDNSKTKIILNHSMKGRYNLTVNKKVHLSISQI